MKINDYRMIAWNVRQAMNEARGGYGAFKLARSASWWTPAEDEAWTHALDNIINDTNALLADLKAARAVVLKKETKNAA